MLVVMGRDVSRRWGSVPGFPDPLVPPPRFLVVNKAVFVDEVLVGAGRGVLLMDEVGVFCSFRGKGESLRMEVEEGARGWPAEPVYRRGSAEKPPCNAGGWGDGAGETLAAATALRIWVRTWEAWRSVSQATCWRRKSTVTWNSAALPNVSVLHGQRQRTRGGIAGLHFVPWDVISAWPIAWSRHCWVGMPGPTVYLCLRELRDNTPQGLVLRRLPVHLGDGESRDDDEDGDEDGAQVGRRDEGT